MCGDIAHKLSAEAGDFIIVVMREASEEHWAKGKIGDNLVDNAGCEQEACFARAHELKGGAGVDGKGESRAEGIGDGLVFKLVRDTDVVVRPSFSEVEEGREFGDQVDSGCLIDV